MPIAWKLKEVLERHELSVYALSEHMGGEQGGASKRPGLYAITSSDAAKRPTRVSFDLLSGILTSLNELTGRDHSVGDVLEFTPDREPDINQEWMELARSLEVELGSEPGAVPGADTQIETPRRRGRPKGSRNRKVKV